MEQNESKRGQKLYYYLSRLDAKELKDFHAYLSSPLLGNSPQMARMLLTIQREVLPTDRKTIDADLFQAEFFPDEPLDEGKRKYIRIRLVQMHSKLMDFVAFMEYKGDTNAHHVHLLKAMHTRGWEKYFERTYQEIEAMPPKKDFGEYHLYRMRREIVRNDHLTSKASNIFETNLPETAFRIQATTTYLILKYSCAILSADVSADAGIIRRFDQVAIEYSKLPEFSCIPEIEAYANAHEMLRSLSTDSIDGHYHFQKLKEIFSSPDGFDQSEVLDLFAFANNYCMFLINHGQYDMIPNLRALYSDALKSGIFSTGGFIQKVTFYSIVSQMCKLGEYEWSVKFVERWKGRIAGDENDMAYYVNRAYIHFLNKEYTTTIELLYNRVDLLEERKVIGNARLNLWQAIWAIGDYTWLLTQLEASRVEAFRNKTASKQDKAVSKRFISHFVKMCRAQLGNPDKTLLKLEKVRLTIESNGETKRFFWLYRALCEEIQRRNSHIN